MLKLRVIPDIRQIRDDMTVSQVSINFPPPSWEEVFKNSENELKDISNILENDKVNGKRLPNNSNLFQAFWKTPLNNIKVVIFGQDPYHTILQNGTELATGMAFSIPKGAPIPSSLRNIYKEMNDSMPEFRLPSHGDLSKWASQGVLLLNSSLTVREKEAGSHKEIWTGFLKKVIKAVIDNNPKCIFVAWGSKAQKIAKKFVGGKATILEAVHPSGLSAHRGFFGCGHFVEINKLLTERKKSVIDWNLD